ncbi:LIM-domain-containing protein [Schizophyllum fasciatum]
MFGTTARCPRCSQPVYAAEQAIGPARAFYHKACLRCASCDKRLDSGSLLEHHRQPYCNLCHLRLFSTRDLRHANLPHAPSTALPAIAADPLAHTHTRSRYGPALGATNPAPRPTSPTKPAAYLPPARPPTVTPHRTGTSSGTPTCARCARPVYFAEQVRAASRTYHKACLRCPTCATALTSANLRDHAGDVVCVRCYGKVRARALRSARAFASSLLPLACCVFPSARAVESASL